MGNPGLIHSQTSDRDFLVVQWLRFHLPVQQGVCSIHGGGTKISYAMKAKYQNIKQKEYYNKFSKDFKNGLHKKKKNLLKSKIKQKTNTLPDE